MKIVSYNINGIRASSKQGLMDWVNDYDADIYCFQEVRSKEWQAKEIVFGAAQLDLFGSNPSESYVASFNCGKVAGYAGTMILSKTRPDKVILDMGDIWQDDEGRTITAIFGNLAVVNAYIPNGNSRLEFKMQYLLALNKFLQMLKKKYFVICVGDFNIAHNEIDLTNPKECSNKSVFLPIERNAFSSLLDIGLIDTFRYINPNLVKYSWRSYRSTYDNSYNSWKYRIDYILVSEELKGNLEWCDILEKPFSDHLPVVLSLRAKIS